MKRCAQKITAILLIGILLYNSLGYLLVIPLAKAIHRQYFVASLTTVKTPGLVTFVFQRGEENQFLKPETDEIRINGKMFDILSTSSKGNMTVYICARDRGEEKLNVLSSLMARNNNPLPLDSASKLILEQIIKFAEISQHFVFAKFFSFISYPNFLSSRYVDPILQVPDHPPCIPG